MTTLEQQVWAAAYVHALATSSDAAFRIAGADLAVMRLRDDLEEERVGGWDVPGFRKRSTTPEEEVAGG